MGLTRTLFRLVFAGAMSAVLIAVGVRFLDEFLGLRPRDREATYRDIESAEETRNAYEAERIELDRTVLPGISVRS